MTDQKHLAGSGRTFEGFEAAEPLIEESRTFRVPQNFKLRAVDPTAAIRGVPGDDFADPVADDFGHLPVPKKEANDQLLIANTNASEEAPLDDKHLGGLDDFVGNFVGNGLNIIFRPRNGDEMSGINDNLLEINVTRETLQFLSRDVLKAIPNRGFGGKSFKFTPPNENFGPLKAQPDVILRGIPYMQQITDLIDQKSFTLREPGIPIHFEQGLFLRTPRLARPDIGPTISRLASIPHGTTINAQCEDPGVQWKLTPPNLGLIGITPFPINPTQKPTPTVPAFDNFQLNPKQATRNRIPNFLQSNDKLSKEEKARVDDFASLNAIKNFKNPVRHLIDYNAVKDIIKHRTFEVTTKHPTIPGGGTANIGFLQGTTGPESNPTDANANAVKVTCQYWISVVRVELALKPTAHPFVEVTPEVKPEKVHLIPKGVKYIHPTFIVPLKRPLLEPIKFDVDYVQIQYAQNVTLDFGPLSWPHVSVASLIPAGLDMSGKIELLARQLPKKLQ